MADLDGQSELFRLRRAGLQRRRDAYAAKDAEHIAGLKGALQAAATVLDQLHDAAADQQVLSPLLLPPGTPAELLAPLAAILTAFAADDAEIVALVERTRVRRREAADVARSKAVAPGARSAAAAADSVVKQADAALQFLADSFCRPSWASQGGREPDDRARARADLAGMLADLYAAPKQAATRLVWLATDRGVADALDILGRAPRQVGRLRLGSDAPDRSALDLIRQALEACLG